LPAAITAELHGNPAHTLLKICCPLRLINSAYFVEIQQIQGGPNLKCAELTIYKFKNKIRKYFKKLDKILRLLVIFFSNWHHLIGVDLTTSESIMC
jgi:hypothetical protein